MEKTESVRALRLTRKMRGRTQAHLIVADDGCTYVVKFAANRNGGRRALVNEFLGSVILTGLGIATPRPALVEIGDDCVSAEFLPPGGTHFGSRYPGDGAISVYDFLPNSLVQKVSNREDFVGALVFDLWCSNTDSRQAIFFRDRVRQGFMAEMIDNGSLFGGSDWSFQDSAEKVMYHRPEIYGSDLSTGDFAPWLEALAKLRPEVLNEAVAAIPRGWIRGDERALDDLLSRLFERRMLVPAMIEQSVEFLRAGRHSKIVDQPVGVPAGDQSWLFPRSRELR
jgi:hypothetical protein